MPRRINADGRTIVVPDDATPEEINQIVGPAPSKDTPAPAGDWRDPLTRTIPHGEASKQTAEEFVKHPSVGTFLKGSAQEANTAAQNIGGGLLGVLLHPVDTATSIIKQTSPIQAAEDIYAKAHGKPTLGEELVSQFTKQPLETAEQFAGQTAALSGAGEAAAGVTRALPKVAGRVAEGISKTGPRQTAKLVTETQEANEGIRKSNAQTAQAHFEKTLDALHKTQGNELQYQQALKAAEDSARDSQRALDAAHEEAVQNALQETREKEDLYQQELRKAKQESEQTYQKKLAEVEKKRAKAELERRQELHRYLGKKSKIQEDFSEAQEKFKSESTKQGKIEPTQERIKTTWSNLRAGAETAREKALVIGNEKYSGVNSALSHVEADPEVFANAVGDAAETLRGSKTEPALLKAMEKSVESGSLPTYADLQGDYSALGKEISKGNLPGDVFHAYDQLHEAIGDEMQRIADSKGQGSALRDARNYWRRMKQTFGQPLSEGDAATKTLRSASAEIASTEEQSNRIRLLGSFDPRLPGLFEHLQNLQKGAQSLPNPVPEQTRLKSLVDARKVLPNRPSRAESIPNPEPVVPRDVSAPSRVDIPNRPESVQPNLPKLPEREAPPDRPNPEKEKTIGAEEIRGAKEAGLKERANMIRRRGEWIATGAAGYRALSSILHGNLAAVPPDLLEGGIAVAGVEGISRLLENPKVVEFLTRPTPRDLAQVPPELRGDMRQIAQIAAKKGIKVDPRIYAAAGLTAPKKGVAAALAP